MSKLSHWSLGATLAASMAALSGNAAAVIVVEATGDLATVTAARDQFRGLIGGGVVPGANGLFGGVRREINWDGVPDGASSPNNLPNNFFNLNSPRGAEFSTPNGTAVQVSQDDDVDPPPGTTPDADPDQEDFSEINPNYLGTFETFSPERLFTGVGSNIVDVTFFLAGTSTPGGVSAFGVVFSDVDLEGPTTISYFNVFGGLIDTFVVPATLGSETFSFLGVQFSSPIVRSVRITNGTTALGPDDDPTGATPVDVVVMDDFLFAEPTQPVAEPATLALLGMGLTGLWMGRRRRATWPIYSTP